MGWWGTGHGDDVIGDGPADTLGLALSALARERGARGDRALTPAELLSTVARVIEAHPARYVSDAPKAGSLELVARTEPESASIRSRGADGDPTVAVELRRAFDDIAMEYEDSPIARKPRLSELLAAIAFVLRPEPEAYLADAEGMRLAEITGQWV